MKTSMKKLTVIAMACAGLNSIVCADITLNGAGASFPAPVYQAWTYAYSQATEGVTVNYQSIGSGAGITQIKSKTVDFAGTDTPVKVDELEKDGLEQFPMLQGAVVLIVNLPGIKDKELYLNREILSKIFLGEIKKWNDPAIVALNPSLKLPKRKITVVRRADSSGTTFIFTSYLSGISPTWKNVVGSGSSVKWPVGIGGQKNPGVCNTVSKIQGAIGYTEYAYAVEAKLGTAKIDDEILGTTYIVVRKDRSAETRKALDDFFAWCRNSGKAQAEKLGYIPVIAVDKDEKTVNK